MLVAEVFFNVARRHSHGRRLLVEPRSAPDRRGADARRLALACVSRGDPAVARPADRGCGLDRLPLHVHRRSVSCCCSPIPRTRRSRWRSTARAVLLFDLPVAAALALVQMVAVVSLLVVLTRMQERRAVTQHLVAARDTARRPRGQRAVARRRRGRRHDPVPRRSARGAGGAVGADRWRLVARGVPGAREQRVDRHLVRPGNRGAGELARVRRAGRVHRGGRRGLGLCGHRVATGTGNPRDGHGADAPARHFGGHGGLRLPRRARPRAARPARQDDARPIAQAVVAIPFVIRAVVPALRSIDPRLRDAAAVLGASPRRVWQEVDLPITLRAFTVGFGFRGRGVARGVRRDLVRRPSRFADHSDRDLALPRAPGALNVGQAMAMSTILMVVTGAVVLRDRTGSRPPTRRAVMLRVEDAVVRFGDRERGRWRRPRGRRGGDGGDPRPERLREDDPAACDRRPATARRRSGHLGRRRPRPGAAAPPAFRSDVPGVRVVPAPRRERQRRVRLAHGRNESRRARSPRRRGARARRFGCAARPPRRPAVGRRAAAGRAGPGARGRAAAPHARRAARRARPRRGASACSASSVELLDRTGLARDLRDARSRRGVRTRRSDRRHARGDGRAVGATGRRVAPPGRSVDRGVPRLRAGRRGALDRGWSEDAVGCVAGRHSPRRRTGAGRSPTRRVAARSRGAVDRNGRAVHVRGRPRGARGRDRGPADSAPRSFHATRPVSGTRSGSRSTPTACSCTRSAEERADWPAWRSR